MIEIELPDGTIAEFPDGTPQEAIKGALQKRFGGGRPPAQPQKPFGQIIRENVLGDNDDTTQNTGEKIGTFLNKAGESLTFGLVGDEASAAAAAAIPGGRGRDERLAFERQQEELLEKTNPGAALTADIGGALVGAALPMGAIGTLGRGAGLLPRIGASAAAGAGMGGTAGFMEGEGVDDRLSGLQSGATVGGVVGGLVPAVGAGVQKLADGRAAKKAINEIVRRAPGGASNKAAARGLYGEIDDLGVQVKPEAFDRLRSGMSGAMDDVGLDILPGPGSLTPKSARVNQIAGEMSGRMAQEPTAALPFNRLDQLRRHAGNAASDVTPLTGRPTPDARVGTEAVNVIDDFVRGLKPDDVTNGDVKALQDLIPKARELWARGSRTQLIDDALENSENYLSGPASGIRNQFRRILKNPKLRRGFSEAEVKMMKRVAQGSFPEQLLYLMGGGLGNLGSIGIGSTLGPVGALAGVGAAAGLRKAAEGVARKNANIARAVVSDGGLKNLPKANDSARKLIEGLMRRGTAAAVQ